MNKLLMGLALLVFTSCSQQKKLAKAVDRVINNKEATEKVGREWEKTNPAIVDTFTAKQKSDTTRTFKSDTTVTEHIEYENSNEYADTTGDWFERLLDSTKAKTKPTGKTPVKVRTKTITNTVNTQIRDSTTYYMEDRRRLIIALDSVNTYKGYIVVKDGVIAEQSKMIKDRDVEIKRLNDEHKKVGKMLGYAFKALVSKWWFWGIVILLIAWFTRRLWGKFLGPFGAFISRF